MIVSIDTGLADKIRLGVLALDACRAPEDGGAALFAEIEALCSALAERHRDATSGTVPGVDEARRLYRAVGLDPTKTRPSSEALLRRAIKEKGLYRVHPLVDLFNLVSLEQLLPVGLYDRSKLVGESLAVRLGRDGEGFEGIRRGRINVDGRLCVADALGPCGSPTADSLRTSIEGPVSRALAVFFQPLDGERHRLHRALDRAEQLSALHLGSRTVSKRIIEGAKELPCA